MYILIYSPVSRFAERAKKLGKVGRQDARADKAVFLDVRESLSERQQQQQPTGRPAGGTIKVSVSGEMLCMDIDIVF